MQIIFRAQDIDKLRFLIDRYMKFTDQNLSNFNYKDLKFNVDNTYISNDDIIVLDNHNVEYNGYAVWLKVNITNLNNPLPQEISWRYGNIDAGTNGTAGLTPMTYADLTELSLGTTHSIRYYQPNTSNTTANDITTFNNDTNVVDVLNIKKLTTELTKEEYNTNDPDYNGPVKTIEYIDQNWNTGEFSDFLDAKVQMLAIFDTKGIDQTERWNNTTIIEHEILVRWQCVDLALAQDVTDNNLSTIVNKYTWFEDNMLVSLQRRFTYWFMMWGAVLKRTNYESSFKTDFNWTMKDEYEREYMRFKENNPSINELIDFNFNVVANYPDSYLLDQLNLTMIETANEIGSILIEGDYSISFTRFILN